MIWPIAFGLITLIPLVLLAYYLLLLITEKRSQYLLFHFYSFACASLFYAFILSRWDLPYMSVLLIMSSGFIIKYFLIARTDDKVKKQKFLVPFVVLILSIMVLYKEYKDTPTVGYGIDRPVLIDPDFTLIVGKGGNTAAYNHHIHHPRQRWALDISGRLGWQETLGFFRGDPAAFRIFGRPVLSPCDAEVLAVKDDLPDQRPGEMLKSIPEGNYVELSCEEFNGITYLFRYAHLKQGSTPLEPRQRIAKNEVLGLVGNTGDSSWPHLHIDVIEQNTGEAVPLFIGGRFLRAGDVIPM